MATAEEQMQKPLPQLLLMRRAADAYSKNVWRRQKESVKIAISRGYLKTLDSGLILRQWGDLDGEGLGDVQRISLPGSQVRIINDTALISCLRLRICNLPNCYLEDMGAFYGCVHLLKLDLSNNQVRVFGPTTDVGLRLTFLNTDAKSVCIVQMALSLSFHPLHGCTTSYNE